MFLMGKCISLLLRLRLEIELYGFKTADTSFEKQELRFSLEVFWLAKFPMIN